MGVGFGKENTVKLSRPVNRKYSAVGKRKHPGRISSAISIGQTVIYFTVDRHRKDYKEVEKQTAEQKHKKLPAYEQSLFDSCFKKWGVRNEPRTTSATGTEGEDIR